MAVANPAHLELVNHVENMKSDRLNGSYPRCTCRHPAVKYRNGSGHHESCPVHIAWSTNWERRKNEVKTKQAIMSEPYCAYCGTPKEDGRVMCRNCGAPYRREG